MQVILFYLGSVNLTRKTYDTHRQKAIDFGIGFGGWFALNVILAAIVVGVFSVLGSIGASIDYSQSYSNLVSLVILVSATVPTLLNLGLMIYLAFTRRWISVGALVAFMLVLLPILCLIGVFVASCSNTNCFQ